jgi:hypothetical protein
MLYACAVRFDVTENLIFFAIFFELNKVQMVPVGEHIKLNRSGFTIIQN